MMKLSKMHKRLLALSAVLPLGSAYAQSAPVANEPQLETVTVTAQRRAESIRDVPLSVTQLRDEKLDVLMSGGGDIRTLAAKVPSLNIESSNGRVFPRFYIRGYGNTDFSPFSSQPVSLIYDDVVLENPLLKGYPIYDLADLEVLRGPQGTLFGRNTPAGVVKFESAKPKLNGKLGGYYNVSYGTHATTSADGAVNIPINDQLAMRVSTLRQHRDDYVSNLYTGEKNALEGYNEHAERIQLLYKPTSTFDALFNVHQRTTSGSARVFRANAIAKGSNDLGPGYTGDNIYTDGQNYQGLHTFGGSARLSWDLGDYKLHSITGIERGDNYRSRGDIDGGVPVFIPGTPASYASNFDVESMAGVSSLKQFTQELRIESQYAGPLNWQAGVYYFDEDVQAFSNGYNSQAQTLTTYVASRQKNKASAAFGSVSYAVNDAFTLRGGLRYTKDKKDFFTVAAVGVTPSGPSTASENKGKATWDVSGNYKLNQNTSLYARVATGFRAPSIAAAANDGTVPITIADAETITSYEAGIKTDLFNKRARASFSVYDFTVKNQQLTVVGGTSNVSRLINADKTVGRGVEADFEGFITNQFKVSLGGSYNFTEIKDPNLSVASCRACTMTDPVAYTGPTGTRFYSINGNSLPQAPKVILNATARYAIPVGDGEMFVFTDWSYRSKINFFLYESTEFTGRSMLEGGLRLGYQWDNGKYEVAAFGRNITNTVRVNGAIDFNNLTGFVNEPRMVGLQFKGAF